MGLFGSSNTKTKSEPWRGVKDELYWVNDQAKLAGENALKNAFTGSTYAQLTPDQLQALGMQRDFATGMGSEMAGLTADTARSLAGGGANFGVNADAIYTNYGGPATQGIMSRVGSYMNDPVLNDQIAQMRANIARSTNEALAPQQGDYALSGNTNSTRAGVMDAIVRRGAEETAAREEANLRFNQYGQALNAAQSDYFQGANTALAANSQVGQAAELSMNANDRALSAGQVPGAVLGNAGAVQQANQQGILDDQYQQWVNKYQQPLQTLSGVSGILSGSGQYGVQTAKGGGSTLGTIAGLGTTAAGMYFGGPMGASLGASAGAALNGGQSPTGGIIRNTQTGMLGGRV